MATKTKGYYIHHSKGVRGVRVYYLMAGTETIHSDVALRTSGNRVIFPDGWNPAKSCYLTQGQCRRATGLAARERIRRAQSTLRRAVTALEEGHARLEGLVHDMDENL